MAYNLYTPFCRAASDVFKLMLGIDATAETPEPLDEADDRGGVSVLIGITGDLSGEVSYRFPKDTTLKMASIMCGMEVSEVDALAASALGEIANIISGNALIGLSEQEITCDILPPQIVIGGTSGTVGSTLRAMATNIRTEIGNVGLDLHFITDAPLSA